MSKKAKTQKAIKRLNLSDHTLDINIRKCNYRKFDFSETEGYVGWIMTQKPWILCNDKPVEIDLVHRIAYYPLTPSSTKCLKKMNLLKNELNPFEKS